VTAFGSGVRRLFDPQDHDGSNSAAPFISLRRPRLAKLRIVVVGAGFMGRLHCLAAKALPQAEVVGVVDLNEGAARRVGDELGIAYSTDLETAIRSWRPDAAIIATPDPAHLAPSLAAIDAGLPILVEKPLATRLDDAETIERAARNAGTRVMPGHILRFDPRYIQARQALHSGAIGKPFLITARHWSTKSLGDRVRSSTSPLWHFAIHHIDAIQWISGSRIDAVDGAQLLSSADGSSSFITMGTLDNGVGFQISTGWTLPDTGGRSTELEIHSENGIIRITAAPNAGLALWNAERGQEIDCYSWPVYDGSAHGLLRSEIEHFVQALVDGTDFAISAAEAIDAIRAALSLEQSAIKREGR
jgi:predicted dehydrogenase